jgi:hypothetical protein
MVATVMAGTTLLVAVFSAGPAGAAHFSDVPDDHPFAPAINFLSHGGADVIQGYPDGTFRPGAPVTRQEMAAFLYRFQPVIGPEPVLPGTPGDFTDVPAGHLFATEIAWMAANGLADGYGDGTFRPGAPVTRQATSAFL